MTPVSGISARATRPTASMPAALSPASPVAEVASGGTGPSSGPAVVSVPCIPLMRLRLRCRTVRCGGGAPLLPVAGAAGSRVSAWSGHALVRRDGEEVLVLVGKGHLGEQCPGIVP